MPAGPSHNRSSVSSHSSHSGGGFSTGSFRGGGFNPPPIRPVRVRLFGSHVIVSTGKQSLLIFLIVLLCITIFGAFVTSSIKSSANDEITTLKASIAQKELDAVWYANAKTKADAGTDENFFIATAQYKGFQRFYYNASDPTGYYYDGDQEVRLNNIPYFYLIYTYTTPDGETHEGETYSSFTSSEASGWDKKIIVGYDNGSWASINYSYKLSENKEYLFEKQQVLDNEDAIKSANTVFIGFIIAIIIEIIVLVLVVKYTIKKGKEEYLAEQEKNKAEIEKKTAEATVMKNKAAQINRKCQYCGGNVPDDADKCPSCGASKFK